MTQTSLPFDYPGSPHRLYHKAEEYYKSNPDLLYAHIQASRVLSDNGITTSARFLTEFVRWMRTVPPSTMQQLLNCYVNLKIYGNDDYKVPNATSAYLTRKLIEENDGYPGFRIKKAASKMDEVIA